MGQHWQGFRSLHRYHQAVICPLAHCLSSLTVSFSVSRTSNSGFIIIQVCLWRIVWVSL
ncbi:Uncharacterised protein [Vibrio cholerae]|nr:Uncharacterised protein [Vibrio cholerae]